MQQNINTKHQQQSCYCLTLSKWLLSVSSQLQSVISLHAFDSKRQKAHRWITSSPNKTCLNLVAVWLPAGQLLQRRSSPAETKTSSFSRPWHLSSRLLSRCGPSRHEPELLRRDHHVTRLREARLSGHTGFHLWSESQQTTSGKGQSFQTW